MENTDAERETHQETTNMSKVVQARQESQNKSDRHIEEDEKEILDRALPVLPGVEKIEKGQSNNAKDGTRSTHRRVAGWCVVSSHDIAKDSSTDIHQQESNRSNSPFHVLPDGELYQEVEEDMNHTSVEEDRGDESEPLVWLWALIDVTVKLGVRDSSTKAADCLERAESVVLSGVRAHENDRILQAARGFEHLSVLDALNVVHTRGKSGSHVDEDWIRGTDEDVEIGLGRNGGPS